MYAIIATGGKQYKVAEGDVIRVEKLGVEAGQEGYCIQVQEKDRLSQEEWSQTVLY